MISLGLRSELIKNWKAMIFLKEIYKKSSNYGCDLIFLIEKLILLLIAKNM